MIADPNKKTLIIVESPTKAKTISKYLPSSCKVMASLGHIVDLNPSPDSKDGTVYGIDVENGFKLDYRVVEGKEKLIGELKSALKGVEQLVLASDEDREGESIAWHLYNTLKPKVPVYRMVFHEITKKAITEAFSSCRDIDMNLVYAQEARRVVDRLQGYGISPILSRKLGGKYSAGRVQSPALKLIVEKENQRRRFKYSDYVTVTAMSDTSPSFKSTLVSVASTPVASGKSFNAETGEAKKGVRVLTAEDGIKIAQLLEGREAEVKSVIQNKKSERPSMPFTTSTLQMDGTRKLGKSAKEIMSIAQRLYENGFITYMRTDSPTLSSECIRAAADYIRDRYGDSMLEVRQYKAKTLGAQEAHEAIRPSGDRFRTPEETGLSGDELKLYTLIWKRTIASQMKDSLKAVTTVRMDAGDYSFSASGSVILFDGFRKVYMASSDGEEEEKEETLPPLKEGDRVTLKDLSGKVHTTQPPQRYTEATLVQKLESEEIGRPSTYATIISTLIDRGYVVRQSGTTLVPTFTGYFVESFLEKSFHRYIAYDFTKEMEAGLDRIARGEEEKEEYLRQFWFGNGEENGAV